MTNIKFNLNESVKVELTDKGIRQIAKHYNAEMPHHLRTCYTDVKKRMDEDGLFTFQMHVFIDLFGGLGITIGDYVNSNVELITTVNE